jgi:hypothetical protein
MASTYTTNLGIEKIATGEQSGTWGATTNTNLDLIDQAVNGVVQITVAATGSTGSPNALTITNGSASDGRNKFIDFYSPTDLGGTVYYQLDPNDAEKIAFVRNSLGGGQTLVLFQGTYNASNDVEVPNGVDMLVKFDGTGASATVTNVFEKLQVNALSVNDGNITNVGDIALDSISADGTDINVSVSDNSATALTVKEGSNTYLTIDTTNSAEKVLVSKTLDIGDNNITNVGNIALDSISADGTQIDIDITDNTASAFTISEGANNYIAITTTDGSELITVSKNSTFAGTTIADLGVVTTVDINGGTIDGVTIGGASAGAITGTTITGTSFVSSGDMTFGDNDKAIFGAGSDLQIYHGGTSSRIQDLGTGNLIIDTDGTEIQLTSGNISQYMLRAVKDGAVTLYHNGTANPRLATTATGIDVTGTVTADGASLDGAVVINESGADVDFRIESATNSHMLFVDAGNSRVGIETASPTSKLQIAGMAAGEQALLIESPRNDALSNGLVRINITDSFCPFAGLQIDHAGTGAAIIANGNVGIGTTSPASLLDVNGGASASIVTLSTTSGNPGARIHLLGSPSSFKNWAIGASAIAVNGALEFVPSTTNGGSTFTTPAMIIDSSSNVGIGTSAPNRNVEVSSLYDTTLRLASTRNTNSWTVGDVIGQVEMYSADGTAPTASVRASVAAVVEDASGASTGLAFRTYNNTERLRIDSSGNLGIGTTSPSSRLHISGTGGLQSRIENTGNTGSDSSRYIIKVGGTSAGDPYIDFLVNGGSEYSLGIDNSDSDKFKLSASGALGTGDLVTVTSSGNVGIGTTDPGTMLDVAGNARVRGSATPTLTFNDGAIENTLSITSSSFVLSVPSANPITFHTTNTERMRIDSSGNLDLTAGGGDIIMANGAGIDFSASAGGGASSSILDDYEEGTWTPSWTNLTIGNGTQTHTYTKVGRLVTLQGIITFGSTTSISGGLGNAALPFTADTTQRAYGIASYLDSGTENYQALAMIAENNLFSLLATNASGTYSTYGNLSATVPFTWTTSDVIRYSITYMTS